MDQSTAAVLGLAALKVMGLVAAPIFATPPH
jgi:hypothetical protein